MEIKLIARVIGTEEQTNTRETFWWALKIDPGRGEQKIYEEFPKALKERIQDFIWRNERLARTLWPFRRRPVLSKDFLISVKSLRYGSLEILLSFLAGDHFPLNATDVVQLAPAFLAGFSNWFLLILIVSQLVVAATINAALGVRAHGRGCDRYWGRKMVVSGKLRPSRGVFLYWAQS